MDISKLKDIVTKLLDNAQPTQSIIQNLSKAEMDEVSMCLEKISEKAIKNRIDTLEKAAKGFNYKIEGVTGKGYLPEGHPERQIVVDHINKLTTLPNDHKLKSVALNIARALKERHLDEPAAINDKPVQTPRPTVEPKPLNYQQINQPAPAKESTPLDYSKFEKPQQEPAATLTYPGRVGDPAITVHKPKTV